MSAVPIEHVLIEADELAAALESGQSPLVLDVRWNLGGPSGREEFEQGHIPFAQWVDLETELAGPPSADGRHPLPDPATFSAAMRRVGVSADGPVVVCDGKTSLSAARLWWMLTDAGYTDVRVLNGGVAAWQAAELPMVTGSSLEVPPGDFTARPGHRASITATELAAAIAGDHPPVLVDVRAPERYAGESEPMDPVAGHIPGAVNDPSAANLTPDGRFRPPVELALRLRDLGLGDEPVVYCGSGITAAHSLLAMEIASLRGGRLFPGSWSSWITDPDRPVATGR